MFSSQVSTQLKGVGGVHVKFDRSFMLWMKENVGKTKGDAVTEWNRRQAIQNRNA